MRPLCSEGKAHSNLDTGAKIPALGIDESGEMKYV